MLNLIELFFLLLVMLVWGSIIHAAFGTFGLVFSVVIIALALPMHFHWMDRNKR